MSAPKPPGIQDCAHGYYDGMGCGLCGDPIRQRDAEIATLRAERDALRDKNRELNRRVQSAESGLAQAAKGAGGRSFGRALANSAARMYAEQVTERDARILALEAEATVARKRKGLLHSRIEKLEAEAERLRAVLDCRAGRLLKKQVPFFVVKASEPYAEQVVDMIRAKEGADWTDADEAWARAALRIANGEEAGT